MGRMEQVARLLGVELGEKFEIEGREGQYYFTENDLTGDNSLSCPQLFYKLIGYGLKIRKLP